MVRNGWSTKWEEVGTNPMRPLASTTAITTLVIAGRTSSKGTQQWPWIGLSVTHAVALDAGKLPTLMNAARGLHKCWAESRSRPLACLNKTVCLAAATSQDGSKTCQSRYSSMMGAGRCRNAAATARVYAHALGFSWSQSYISIRERPRLNMLRLRLSQIRSALQDGSNECVRF